MADFDEWRKSNAIPCPVAADSKPNREMIICLITGSVSKAKLGRITNWVSQIYVVIVTDMVMG